MQEFSLAHTWTCGYTYAMCCHPINELSVFVSHTLGQLPLGNSNMGEFVPLFVR